MRRSTAMKIAQSATARGKPLAPALLDEIITTQMAASVPPRHELVFVGWTTDEKIAFYERGLVPERFKS
jgi:hypothetical protein